MIGNPQGMPLQRHTMHTNIQIENPAKTTMPPLNEGLLPGTILDKGSTTHDGEQRPLKQMKAQPCTPVKQPDAQIK